MHEGVSCSSKYTRMNPSLHEISSKSIPKDNCFFGDATSAYDVENNNPAKVNTVTIRNNIFKFNILLYCI